MEIKQTYVNFEQAKSIKEKGFNLDCETKYESNGELSELNSLNGSMDWNNTKFSRELISRPEQWQVTEWLRINHGVFVSVETDCYGEIWFSKLSCCSKQNWENLEKRFKIMSANKKFNNEHKTPQEAYSEAFDYVLKELI